MPGLPSILHSHRPEGPDGPRLVAWRSAVLPLAAATCLLPGLPAWAALLAGMGLGLAGLNPWPDRIRKWSHLLLQATVVALGAGLNLGAVLRSGRDGLAVTLLSISATLLVGRFLGRRLGVSRDATWLISGGTAICGGSAIAALSGTLRPRAHEVSIALITVYLFNAVALLIFPSIGHAAGLNQTQFGWWAALAIHDTSSVVGAGVAYGATALAVGTTIKLARSLWIVPLTFGLARARARGATADRRGTSIPWFVLGFLIMAAVFSYLPGLAPAAPIVTRLAQRGLVLTLFLIGAGFSREALRTVGLRPLKLGLILWITVATASLAAIKLGWIAN
ncbi:MAG TPA: putative sulfate exporter family transporter [Candidatus Didemnitutus sp.]